MAKVKNRPLCHRLGSQLVFETALVVVLQKKALRQADTHVSKMRIFFPISF